MDLVERIQKLARFRTLQKITPQEYVENLFYTVAAFESVTTDVVDCVVESLPQDAGSALIDYVGVILAEDFRYPDLHYGGAGPSHEERERKRLVYQQRARTFATLLQIRLSASEIDLS